MKKATKVVRKAAAKATKRARGKVIELREGEDIARYVPTVAGNSAVGYAEALRRHAADNKRLNKAADAAARRLEEARGHVAACDLEFGAVRVAFGVDVTARDLPVRLELEVEARNGSWVRATLDEGEARQLQKWLAFNLGVR